MLQNLIPIAVAVAAGCERCAESTVARALGSGSARRHVQQTLRIVESVREMDCFAKAAGADSVRRMDKPLEAAWKAIRS
jgi:AhpD family alkylhydroperoxidase